jgi:outer membrane protein assembly factor BamD (BamD/ComL family)
MKKIFVTVAVIAALVGVAGAVIYVVPSFRDEAHWQWASYRDGAGDYAGYLQEWPDGKHVAAARSRYDARSWEEAAALGTIAAYQRYLRESPRGAHAQQARTRIEAMGWRAARRADTIAAYKHYLRVSPRGAHAQQARTRIEALGWTAARRADTVSALLRYLHLYPRGKYAAPARARIETLRWLRAKRLDTVTALQAYIRVYPGGRYVGQARARIDAARWRTAQAKGTIVALERYLRGTEGRGAPRAFARQAETRIAALRVDDRPFEAAERKGTRVAFLQFLARFPGHRRTADARLRIRELTGISIFDLVADGKVETRIEGSDITQVEVSVRRLVDRNITALIPIGTLFASRNASVQNMVSTGGARASLRDGRWHSLTLPAACANRTREIPGAGDTFELRRALNQQELERLTTLLAKRGASFEVRQAAIWIVTDNADFDDLQILVDQFRVPVIDAKDAAQAMRLVEAAGIPLSGRAIWRDRDRILGK